MKYTLFEHLNNLTENKIEYDLTNDEQTKSYSPYMINRFISMSKIYLPVVNEINQYNIPKDAHYNFFLEFLPKRKQYFKYIKKKGEIELSKDNIEKLYKYFKIGPRQLNKYLDILTEDQVQGILEKYNDGSQ